MAKGGGSSGGTTVQTSEPWSGAVPYLTQIMQGAQQAYGQTSKTPYPGQYYAPYTNDQLAGQDYIRQLAPVIQQQVKPVIQLASDTASGKFLDPSSNPALQSAMSAAAQPAVQAFRESVVPGINSAAISSGAYGGARNGLALGRASQGLMQELTNTGAQMAYQNYATERGYQNQSADLFSKALGLQATPAQYLTAVGQDTQTQNQQLLNEKLQKYNDTSQAPWNGLDQYLSLVTGAGGNYGTSTGTASGGSTFGNVLSGALGGAGLAGGIGSLFGSGAAGIAGIAGGPWTLGLGALAGGLAGGLF